MAVSLKSNSLTNSLGQSGALVDRIWGLGVPREGLGADKQYLLSSTQVFQVLHKWLSCISAHRMS